MSNEVLCDAPVLIEPAAIEAPVPATPDGETEAPPTADFVPAQAAVSDAPELIAPTDTPVELFEA